MIEIVIETKKLKDEVWERDKALNILKKKVKYIKLKLLRVFQKVRKYSIYFHGNGMIYAGDHIYLSTGKIGKFFKLTKVS